MIENNEPEKKSGVSAIVIGIVVLLCCVCVLVIGMAGYGYYAFTQIAPTLTSNLTPPTLAVDNSTPASPSELFRPPADTISTETVQILSQSIVPENDVYELACRLQDKCNVPKTLPAPATPLTVLLRQNHRQDG